MYDYSISTEIQIINIILYQRKCQLDACVAVPAFDLFFAMVEIKELPLQINWLNKDICFTYDSLFLLMK